MGIFFFFIYYFYNLLFRQYEEKLAAFYANYPELKPIKAEKMKKVKTSPVATPVTNPNPNSIPLMPYQPQVIIIDCMIFLELSISRIFFLTAATRSSN